MWFGAMAVLLVMLPQACGGGSDDDGGTRTTATSAGGSSGTSTGVGGTDACVAACESMWPGGLTNANLMADCVVCGACYDICDGGVGDVCASGSELGCSSSATSCQECVASVCAWDLDIPTMMTTGVCAAEAQGCIDNNDCLELLDCVSMCP